MSEFHAGFDTDVYPGDDAMAWLKQNTNLEWCGFYLAPAPSHGDRSWMDRRAALAAQGWGLAPVYVGQETIGPGSHLTVGSQGYIDGNQAANLAAQAGFGPGSRVFLDLENGAPLTANQAAYVARWTDALMARGYAPGVYCSHLLAEDVELALSIPTRHPGAAIWAFRVSTVTDHDVIGTEFPAPDPAGCGYVEAVAWQREQDAIITVDGSPLLVDLSTALWADPSAH